MNEEGGRQARGAETSLVHSACVGAAVIGAVTSCIHFAHLTPTDVQSKYRSPTHPGWVAI
jgi:hypothetical protein